MESEARCGLEKRGGLGINRIKRSEPERERESTTKEKGKAVGVSLSTRRGEGFDIAAIKISKTGYHEHYRV